MVVSFSTKRMILIRVFSFSCTREDIGTVFPFYRTIRYELSNVECPQCGNKIEVGVETSEL